MKALFRKTWNTIRRPFTFLLRAILVGSNKSFSSLSLSINVISFKKNLNVEDRLNKFLLIPIWILQQISPPQAWRSKVTFAIVNRFTIFRSWWSFYCLFYSFVSMHWWKRSLFVNGNSYLVSVGLYSDNINLGRSMIMGHWLPLCQVRELNWFVVRNSSFNYYATYFALNDLILLWKLVIINIRCYLNYPWVV